jgi:hypothetical protein
MKDVPDDRPITITVLGAFRSGKSTFLSPRFDESVVDPIGSSSHITTNASAVQPSRAITTRRGRLWDLLLVLFIVFFKSSTF